MISLSISGVCNGCWEIDLKMRESTYWCDGGKGHRIYYIECSHAAVCGKLLEEMKNRRISAPEDE